MRTNQPDKPLKIDNKDAFVLGRCLLKIAHALDGTMFTRAEALALFGFLDGLMFMLMDEHKADLRHLFTWVDRYDSQFELFVEKEVPNEGDD